jgi:putative ABC transport system permease protein
LNTPQGAVLLFRAAVAGPLTRGLGHAALSVVGIALGVALGVAVHLINQSAVDEFSVAAHALAGEADLVVRGPRAGFDESLYPRLARLPEVQAVSPALELDVPLPASSEALKVLGLDPFRAAQVQPALVSGFAGSLLELLAPDAILLSQAAADWLDVRAGGEITVLVGTEPKRLRVIGVLPAGAYRQRLALMDIGSAQFTLGRLGILNRLDLRLRPGTDSGRFRGALAAQLPPGVQLATTEAEAERGAGLTRSYRINLNMLALVALFTGAFLVFTTLALSVLRRRRDFALLRVLGVTGRGILGMVLLEALAIGILGSALGGAGGQLLASVVVERIGADLGAGYFDGMVAGPPLDFAALALFFALGVAAAVLGAAAPALESARTPPGPALRAGDQERALSPLRTAWPGAALCAAAFALARVPPVDGVPVAGYLAVALLLVGAVLLAPRVSALVLGLAPARGPVPLRLAAEQLRGRPGQVGVSMAAILVSVSLMVSMSIMVVSFRESLEVWLAKILPADLYLRSARGGETAFFTPEQQARIRATPGARQVHFLRHQNLWLDSARPTVSLLARPIDAAHPDRLLPLEGEWLVPAATAPPPVWVSETVQDLYGFRTGQVVKLPLAGREWRFTVAGIWRDYARQNGAIYMDRDLYARLSGDDLANDAAIWLAPGHTLTAIAAELRARLPDAPDAEIAETGHIRSLSLGIFDRTFAVTYGLEAVAVLIGLFGISVGVSAQVLARRGEFGMLRHIGMTRGQVAAMLGTEGALTSALGVALGFGFGWAISLILVQVINRQSFHWSMDMHVPWAGLGALALVLIAAATLTAVWSGRRAMGEDVVRAVREDW